MNRLPDAAGARKAFGVALGGIVAMGGVQAAEMIKKAVAAMPTVAPILVLACWFVGTMLGAFLAAKIGQSRLPAYIVGAFLLAFAVVTSIVFPRPIWFSVFVVIVVIAAPFAGMRMAGFGAPTVA